MNIEVWWLWLVVWLWLVLLLVANLAVSSVAVSSYTRALKSCWLELLVSERWALSLSDPESDPELVTNDGHWF